MAKLTDVSGIGPATAKLLAEHDIETVEALAKISLAELKKISGFNGDVRAQSVKKAAALCLKNEPASTVTAKAVSAVTADKQPVVAEAAADPGDALLEGKKAKKDKDKKKIKETKKKDKNKKKGKKKDKKK